MRLGQLARKLKLEPSRIIIFLAKNNIVIDNSPNTKIDEPTLELVFNHFEVPGQPLEEIVNSVNVITKENPLEEEEIVEEIFIKSSEIISGNQELAGANEEESTEVQQIIEKELDIETQEETEELLFNEVDGVIRVPKTQLNGIKVLGKIDLPESKEKKEVKSVTPAVKTTTNSTDTLENIIPSKRLIHPNKENRIASAKPVVVVDHIELKHKEEKPLTKLELKAIRKEEQKIRKKKKIQKAKSLAKKQLRVNKKKKSKTPSPPKRGFWARLLGLE